MLHMPTIFVIASAGTWHWPRWKRGTRLDGCLWPLYNTALTFQEAFLLYG